MIDVKWGPGFKDRYILWLERKWLAGMTCGIYLIVGAFILIYQAMIGTLSSDYVIGLIVYLVTLLLLGGCLMAINKRVHSTEIFLGFYEHRHQVRHEVFCKNHIHCVGLHYFKSYHDHSTHNEE
jgi:hypothetical protein